MYGRGMTGERSTVAGAGVGTTPPDSRNQEDGPADRVAAATCTCAGSAAQPVRTAAAASTVRTAASRPRSLAFRATWSTSAVRPPDFSRVPSTRFLAERLGQADGVHARPGLADVVGEHHQVAELPVAVADLVAQQRLAAETELGEE